ncbi:MAG: T9SS type A sorting domain-containing protein [Bacteroidetes bacterium]|nr:T9SS type A sorting domain-containing protein [Bacteroidota bacterium]
MKKIITILAAAFCLHINAQIINTIAGTGTQGFSGDGGQATAAQLNYPSGVATDAAGNVYIINEHRIRKVSSNGIITTIAGNGTGGFSGDGGAATAAQLYNPSGVATDAAGNVYIADVDNHRIRKVSSNGIITTIAGNGGIGFSGDGGAATAAQLNYPQSVAVDGSGNVYIADGYNIRIRKVSSNGIITTIAGNGTQGFSGDGGAATAAQFWFSMGVATDAVGNVYITDSNSRIRKVNSNGIITTIAGNGTGIFSGDGGAATAAGLIQPNGVAVDAAGNVYISDIDSRIRKVSSSGIITTIAGNGSGSFSGDGGAATAAQLNYPTSVAVDTVNGNIYIADKDNHRVRKVYCSNVSNAGIASSATVICAGHSAVLTLIGSASSYTWSTGQSSSSISVSPATSSTYSLFSTCNISNHVSTYTAALNIQVNPLPSLSVSILASTPSVCAGSTATLVPSGALSYSLGNVSGSSFTVSSATTSVYTISGTNQHACVNTVTVLLNVLPLPTPQICMVSTDSTSYYNYNIVYWDNTQYQSVDSFYIYRYDVALNTNLKIGTVAAHKGQYMDTARHKGSTVGTNGDPNYSSYRYALSIKGLCGGESAKSPYHITEFLQNQHNGNFNVSQYVIENSTALPTGYGLLRDDNSKGTYALIATIPGGATSATDPQYSNFPNANYRVDIFGFNCTASNAKTTALIKAHSNTANRIAEPAGIKELKNESAGLRVYPNPVGSVLSVESPLSHKGGMIKISITDVLGKEILSKQLTISNGAAQINVSTLDKGIYFVKIGNAMSKFVKE